MSVEELNRIAKEIRNTGRNETFERLVGSGYLTEEQAAILAREKDNNSILSLRHELAVAYEKTAVLKEVNENIEMLIEASKTKPDPGENQKILTEIKGKPYSLPQVITKSLEADGDMIASIPKNQIQEFNKRLTDGLTTLM